METAPQLHLMIDVAAGTAQLWGLISEGARPNTFQDLITELKQSCPPGHQPPEQTGWGLKLDHHEVDICELALYRLFDGGEVLLVFDVRAYEKGSEHLVLDASGKTFAAASADRFLHCWWDLQEKSILVARLEGTIPDPAMVKPQLDWIEELLKRYPILDEILKSAVSDAKQQQLLHHPAYDVAGLIHDRRPYPWPQ
jgi:hypothetical protein